MILRGWRRFLAVWWNFEWFSKSLCDFVSFCDFKTFCMIWCDLECFRLFLFFLLFGTDAPSIDLLCLSSTAGSVGTFLASQSSHLNNTSFYYLPERAFPLFFHFVLEEERSFPSFCFLGVFFNKYDVNTTMLSSIIIWYLLPYVPQAQHSTAQRSQPAQAAK